MPDTASITIVKVFKYLGKDEETSNTYHFSGPTPGSDAAWKTLADAMIAEERKFVTNRTFFVRAYGYEPGNELSVAQIDYEAAPNTAVAGQMAPSNLEARMQPESAVTVRWKTNERNTRKKWIYLRKYIHDTIVLGADGETIPDRVVTLIQAWAVKLTDGSLPNGVKYCGPQGAAAGAIEVKPFAVSRELKRRGKRPSR